MHITQSSDGGVNRNAPFYNVLMIWLSERAAGFFSPSPCRRIIPLICIIYKSAIHISRVI